MNKKNQNKLEIEFAEKDAELKQLKSELAASVALQKKAEDAQKFSQQCLDLALKHGNVSYWNIGLDYGHFEFSERYAETFDFALEALPDARRVQERWYESMHEEDREAVRETFRKMDEERRDGCQWSARFRRLSGDWRYIDAYEIVVARDEGGKRSHMAGIGFDVTEQKRAEDEALQAQEALRKGEEQQRVIMNAIGDLVDQITPSGEVIYANEPCLNFYRRAGLKKDEIINGSVFDLVPEDHAEKIREKIAGCNPENPVWAHEHEFLDGDGEAHHMLWKDQALFDEQGNLSSIVGTGRDITGEKKAELAIKRAQEALRKSEEQHRIIMDAVADPIDQITPSGDIIFSNKAYLKFYGKSGIERDEIIGANIFDLVPPEHVDTIREKIAELSLETPIFEHKEEFTTVRLFF